MTTPPAQRPQCSQIILSNELGDEMQKQYVLVYQPTIHKHVKHDFVWSSLINFKNLLIAIRKQDPSHIDGFRIHLGLNGNKLIFLFKGLAGLYGVGQYYEIISNGNNYQPVNDVSAQGYIDNYALKILSLPEIDNGLPGGNTRAYIYAGLFDIFQTEFNRQDSHSPIDGIKIKLSICVFNQHHPEYIKRIVVGFSFMEGTNERYLTDVSGQYGCDIVNLPWTNGPGADTGSPCPPSSNCP